MTDDTPPCPASAAAGGCVCLDPTLLPPGVTNACSAIHMYFGLSYANYLVLPRSVLQRMPPAWQARFVALLLGLEPVWDGGGDYQVRRRDAAGRFVADPDSEYRHQPRGTHTPPPEDPR